MKKFIAILTAGVITLSSLALFIIMKKKTSEDISPTINQIITQNISLPFHKSKDNKPLFDKSNGFWDSSKPNTPSPEDIGGSFEVVYGEINQRERDFLGDTLKVYEMAKLKLQELNLEIPPLWWYLGVGIGEGAESVRIGGILFPRWLPSSYGDIASNYKKGDLLKIPNDRTDKKFVGSKGDGVFQIEKDAYIKDYFGLHEFAIPNQFVAAAHHSSTKMTSSGYKSLSPNIYWTLKSTSHMADATIQFPLDEMNTWIPLLEKWLSMDIGNKVINTLNTYGVNSSNYNKVAPMLLLYHSAKVVGKDNLRIYVQGYNGSSVPTSFKNVHSYVATTQDTFVTKIIPDLWQVIPTISKSSNGALVSSMFKNWKPSYADSYPNLAIERDGKRIVHIRFHAGARHLLQTYHYGRYMEQALKLMLNKASQPQPQTSRKIDNPITPSLYYSEFEQLENGRALSVNPDILDYNNLDKEAFRQYLPIVNYNNQDIKSYSGQFEEVGWKGDYPIFAQSTRNVSGNTPITFNNQPTTLADAGCSIYALTSLLHKLGLANQSIPNDLNNKGLAPNTYITPSSLSKVISAPITPYKVSQLGYKVKQLPTNTPDDIRTLMKEVQNGIPYIVNVRSGDIRAVDGDGNVFKFSFTNSGHFILLTDVHEIKGKLYFEVVDSNYTYPNKDSNRLLFDLEDAIAKDIFKSSSGVPVPALTITGIQDKTKSLYEEVASSIDNNIYTLKSEALIIPEKGRTVIYYDNYNPVVFYKESEFIKQTGIYGVGTTIAKDISLQDIFINDSPITKENIGEVSKGEWQC